MIELTEQQAQALGKTEPVRVLDPTTRTEYVLVRADVYQRLQPLLEDTVAATADLVDRVMAEDDARDPYLEEYQRLYGDVLS